MLKVLYDGKYYKDLNINSNQVFIETDGNKQISLQDFFKYQEYMNNNSSSNSVIVDITSGDGSKYTIKAKNDGSVILNKTPINPLDLPNDFPKFKVVGESPYEGNFFITPHDNNYNFGYFIIINRKGEILHYKKTNKGLVYAPKKYVNSKGQNRYTFLEVITRTEPSGVPYYEHSELVILDENFDEIDRVRHKACGDIPNNFPTENHDYTYIDDGHYIISSYYNGANTFKENSLQEIKNGKVVFHWQTKDHSELKTISHTTPTGDYAHFNALQVDVDGNWIVSFRNIGIVKINRQSKGEIMWVMGRNRNDFSGILSSQICFQQHDVQLQPDGSFTVFDNYGHEKSRVCRYYLNENTMKCDKYKEYITTYNRSPFMGSGTIVDDENDVLDICYGGAFNIAFEEYDFKNNKQLMKVTFDDGSDMYRVYRDIDFCNGIRARVNS